MSTPSHSTTTSLAKQIAEEARKRKEEYLDRVSSECLTMITAMLSNPNGNGVHWSDDYSVVNVRFDEPVSLIRQADEVSAFGEKLQTIGFQLSDHTFRVVKDWGVNGLESVTLTVKEE